MLTHIADLLDFTVEHLERLSSILRMVDEERSNWQRLLHR